MSSSNSSSSSNSNCMEAGGSVQQEGASLLLYKRVNDNDNKNNSNNNSNRGRHLVAATDLEAGRLILAERPLLALQSLDNVRYNRICHGCQAFVGGPDAALLRRCSRGCMLRRRRNGGSNETTTTTAKEEEKNRDTASHDSNDDNDNDADDDDDDHAVVPCRSRCGHVYCSAACEGDTWTAHHSFLCTGDIVSSSDSDDHPLVQFKQYAVSTNEILLLVAEWWVAQHNNHNHNNTNTNNTNTKSLDYYYTDFTMNPWWDVVTADLMQQPGGCFGEAAALQQKLREVCQTAADLFNQAMVLRMVATQQQQHATTTTTTTDHSSSSSISSRVGSSITPRIIPPMTALDVARRVGACEQNAMGLRQRSPLCRNVLFDARLRQRRHAELVHCLSDAGFVGNDNDNDSSDGGDGGENNNGNSCCNNDIATDGDSDGQQMDDAEDGADEDGKSDAEEWDYSVDEIASFLSNLYMNEDFSVRDDDDDPTDDEEQDRREVDDLDVLFPPLDGTCLYATACKMNHSCDPNVILVYKRQPKWGAQHPLTAFCVALRDIAQGEELTISYIDANAPYAERQAALANYGFQCHCHKCQRERSENERMTISSEEEAVADERNIRIGSDEEDEDDEPDVVDHDEQTDSETDGEAKLQRRLERLDSAANHSKFGMIPSHCFEPVSAFVLQTANLLLTDARGFPSGHVASALLEQCVAGIQERDYCLCRIVGCDLEATLFGAFQQQQQQQRDGCGGGGGQWQSTAHREAYFCGAVTACIGFAHEYNFLAAQQVMDKSLALGLHRECVGSFVDFIKLHATQMSVGPYQAGFFPTD